MKKIKPSIPKGTRDFLPHEVAKRNYIQQVMQRCFERFGFLPIQTPSFENLETLTGKYGEEGDRLLFKILNSGDFLANADAALLSQKESGKVLSSISKKGLRYDLTVPLARFVAQHQNELSFPFRRYQIQPVWRADRPQKGRYQEFYQCDIDVLGNNALLNEAELLQIMDMVYTELCIPELVIRINNRKILEGVAEHLNVLDHLTDLTVIIDKLDKIGEAKVIESLENKGFDKTTIDGVVDLLLYGDLDKLRNTFAPDSIGAKGVLEIEQTLNYMQVLNVKHVVFDSTLARGLDYYTGLVVEVVTDAVKIGSIGGGGRYDNLTEMFGLRDFSGVGVSFGFARIYDVMETLNLWPEHIEQQTQLLFINFDAEGELFALPFLQKIRAAGINAEIYPSAAKLKKQMKYADDRKIPFVALTGSEEIKAQQITLKNMVTGEQQLVHTTTAIELLKA